MINYIDVNGYNINNLPDKITISTLTVNFNLGTLLYLENIAKYISISENDIIAVKYGKYNILKCVLSYKDKFKSINKNYKKNFYNQLTIIININNNKYINAKLFKNGSVQMTGCKNLIDINIAINKLINKLKINLYINNDDNNYIFFKNKMNEIDKIILKSNKFLTLIINKIDILYNNKNIIKFCDNIFDITVKKFKIDLINSNFGLNYQINKEQLYYILINNNILCRISSIHACINIKYKITNENITTYVSIFIFQTGNIIIIAKKPEYVNEAYYYIIKLLNENKLNIIKKNILSIANEKYIEDFLIEYKNLYFTK